MDSAKYKFNIEVNKAGQRVVIVNETMLGVSRDYEPIGYEDFDAVLYTTLDSRALAYQFTGLFNVFSHNAFQFKPFFMSTKTTNKGYICSCDGLADSIDSQVLIDETARIQKRMTDYGFVHFEREPDFWTNDNYFYAFVRFGLTRGDILPKMELIKGSPFGYIHPILYVMFRSLNITAAEFLQARTKFQGDYAYVEPVDLVSITHVCPKCYDKGMLYMETCPKCGSIDISEQNMIHHFRCANISPEQTYVKDGKLVCPKCMHEIHHIGVDYDRPTTSYTCNSCSINFSGAKVICECEICGIKSPIENLVPIKMMNMMVNARGKKMLPVTDHMVNMDNVAKFPNILSVNQFKEILTVRLNICKSIAYSGHILRVYRSMVASEADLELYAPDIIEATYDVIPFANIAIKKNVCYLMIETKIDSEVEINLMKRLNTIEAAMKGKVLSMDYLEYNGESDIDTFISLL